MTVLSRYLLATAVGLCLGRAVSAAELAAPVPVNQQIANTIADHLRQNARLSGYHIDVIFQNGVADIYGAVNDQPQKEETLSIAQGVPGVERVSDHLVVVNAYPLTQVQANMIPMPRAVEPGAGPMVPPMPAAPVGPGAPMMPGAPPSGAYPAPPGYPGAMEPTPIYQGGPGGPYSMPAANMPPYAWPTYAPYNNYSRVAEPSAYPPNAWPFIGPEYPFPKVPLGWRAVKLEWVDGHWWFGKYSQCHDWWRIRYW